jgi:endonuclease-3
VTAKRLTKAAARRESKRARRERARELLRRLKEEYPDARCALKHHNPFELLVATILSAQCTDKRVNQVTPELFERYPDPESMGAAPLTALEELVQSTGFFRNKARSLKGLGQALAQDHDSEVPQTMKELTRLPGVGRKTANVVLGNGFGKNVGVVVDTHVGRIARRLGLTKEKSAEKVERDLMELLPQESWTLWSNLLINHGRNICKARKPLCGECVLADLCPSAEL